MGQYSFDAAIFDMDGIITKTASVHAMAWKLVFDEYLKLKESREGLVFGEFTHQDYLQFVDGKPRLKGIQSFLESRGINLPQGQADDPYGAETIYAIGNKKNEKFKEVLTTKGVELYTPTVELIRKCKENGIKVGVVTSSKNCQFVLKAANMLDVFETRVDGIVAEELGLEGKPEGDIFVKAALDLGTIPSRSIVFEDAISGVQAGRNGGFGLVVGVARSNNIDELNNNGADIVVTCLSAVDLDWFEKWFNKKPVALFNVWANQNGINHEYLQLELDERKITINPYYLRTPKTIFEGEKKPVFFLDYDGTLTPIVERPDMAIISDAMRNIVTELSKKFITAIVSGRMREDVEKLAKIKGIFYAGSHGFDILGQGVAMIQPKAKEKIPVISKITDYFKDEIGAIEGVIIEEKKFSVAVHFRSVKKEYHSFIKKIVEEEVKKNPDLRLMYGKMVFEVLPAIDWNKGKALSWIMKALNLNWEDNVVCYIGDDTTDEDAFRAVGARGVGILVSENRKYSAAQFYLSSPDEVGQLFKKLVDKKENKEN
ncbi:MAG: trehalose-phosphatase [Candidatus Omnitrophota bacterium]